MKLKSKNMGMTIHTPDQTREQIEIGHPKCKCGSAFLVYRHKTVRKKLFLGITALCENVDCENHEPLIAHSEAEMLHVLTCNSNQTSNNINDNSEMRVIIKPSGDYSYGVRNSGGFRCFIPRVNHYNGQDARYEQELEEARRDAYLFAAAQTMLKEMERMLVVIKRLENFTEVWDAATQGTGVATSNAYRLAIAKAKGETI